MILLALSNLSNAVRLRSGPVATMPGTVHRATLTERDLPSTNSEHDRPSGIRERLAELRVERGREDLGHLVQFVG
jgi:hypothetical protein